MQRDYTRFPKDDNGDVVWHLCSKGDDLTQSREPDFTVIFPSAEAAIEFAVICLRSGFKVEMEESEKHNGDGLDWNVTVYTHAVPTHTDITALEQSLGDHAAPLGGRASGWSSTFVPAAS